MAIDQVVKRGAGDRVLAALLLAAAAVLAPSALVAQQTTDTPAAPARKARDAIRAAQESYRRGDYEGAAHLYQDADANKQQLTPREQADLADFIKANNTAREASSNGAVHLHQADEYLKQGKMREAAALVRVESANQFLKPADKALLGQLTDQLRAKGATGFVGSSAKAPIAGDVIKEDYGSLVKMARSALQRGDLDTAEWYCKQAEKKAGVLPDWVTPWNDSTSKVERDVQIARSRQAAAAQQVKSNQDGKQDQPSMLTKVKSMFSPNASQPVPDTGPQLGADKNVVAGPAVTSPQGGQQVVSKDTLDARMFRDQAIEALKRNDLPAAKKYAEMAKAKMDPNAWWESPTPEELLRDINRHMGQVVQTGATDAAHPQPASATTLVDAANARGRLKEARALYTRNQFDEAERTCDQIAAVKFSWGLFEDNPDRLRSDIRSARLKADKAESTKLLSEGRKSLAAGNLADAQDKAWKAKQLHGPYSMWDLGDRPDKLLADIETAKAKSNTPGAAVNSNLASTPQRQSNLGQFGPNMGQSGSPPVSIPAMTAKQRAQGLLWEAHLLQSQDRVAEALAKANEARTAAAEAYRAGLGFGPGEESPDMFIISLAAQGKARMEMLVRIADDNANDKDPSRLKKASDSLNEARQLALLLGLDVGPIDAKLVLVRGDGPPPNHYVAAGAQQTMGDPMGVKLLDDSREEIRAGRLEQARKFAEEALDAKYGVQEQAKTVLKSIETETFARMQLDYDRAFTNAYDAYIRKDYRQARSILANVDERMLSAQNKARFREIALNPEMQSGQPSEAIKMVAAPIDVQGPGVANANDMSQPAAKAATDDFGMVTQLSKVEFDKLEKEGLAAERNAIQRAETGDFDGAIDTLRGYEANLKASGLDADQVARLEKSVDRYLQQYQTRKAQKIFQDERTAQNGGGAIREKERFVKQQETQAEIAKLSDQARELMHDGKFDEAQVAWLKIQDLDPDNAAAQVGGFQSRIQQQEKHNAEVERTQKEHFMGGTDPDPGPYVDMKNPISRDIEISNKANQRAQKLFVRNELKDPVEQGIERALLTRKLTLCFKNQPLSKCLEDIHAEIGDINIIQDDEAIQSAGIHMDQLVTLDVTQLSLQSALNVLLKKVHLTYVIKDQCITITTEDNARGKQRVTTFPVADLVIPVENLRSQQNDLVRAHWQAAINQQLSNGLSGLGAPSPYGVPGGLPPGQAVGTPVGGGANQSNTLTGGRVPKPEGSQQMDELLIRLITTTIAPETWSEVGGKGTIQYYPLGLALVVNQTPDIQEQIIDLLTALRRLQDLEVAIEMRLVSVSEAFYEFMGVNFNMNLPTGTATQGNAVQQLVSGNYVPNQLINSFNFSGTPLVSGVTPAGTLTPNLGVPINSSSFGFALPPFGGYPGTLGADGGLSLGLAFLSDVQVSLFMEAAQGDRRTNVMQAPKITVFNGQTASINVGDELYFLTSINAIQVNGQMVFQPQQTPTPYGVLMTVTPVVSADRRFVRLNLNPTLQNLVSATVPLLPVQQIVPQLLYDNTSPPQPTVFTLFFQQPSTSFITLNTTVVVPDGGTVLMGGLKTLVEGRNEAGPPVLSKIPYLNRLFTNVGYGREAQSLMIMVTARIIINEEEELEFTGQLPRIPRS